MTGTILTIALLLMPIPHPPQAPDAQLRAHLITEIQAAGAQGGCQGVARIRSLLSAYEAMRQMYPTWVDLSDFKARFALEEAKCSSACPVLGVEVRTAPVVKIGGGTIQHRVPAVVLATMYMTPAERDLYIAALDPDTRNQLRAWEKEEAAILRDVQDAVSRDVVPLRNKEVDAFLKERYKLDPKQLKLNDKWLSGADKIIK